MYLYSPRQALLPPIACSTSNTFKVVINCDRRVYNSSIVMEDESSSAELARLRKQQLKTRQNEVYGGLSRDERAKYDTTTKRIDELTKQFEAIASSNKAQAEQRHEWNKKSETDAPQSEGRAPYRTREQDSTIAVIDSLKTVRTKKSPIQKETANSYR